MGIDQPVITRNFDQTTASIEQRRFCRSDQGSSNPIPTSSGINDERCNSANWLGPVKHDHLVQSDHAKQAPIRLGGNEGSIAGFGPFRPKVPDAFCVAGVTKLRQ